MFTTYRRIYIYMNKFTIYSFSMYIYICTYMYYYMLCEYIYTYVYEITNTHIHIYIYLYIERDTYQYESLFLSLYIYSHLLHVCCIWHRMDLRGSGEDWRLHRAIAKVSYWSSNSISFQRHKKIYKITQSHLGGLSRSNWKGCSALFKRLCRERL